MPGVELRVAKIELILDTTNTLVVFRSKRLGHLFERPPCIVQVLLKLLRFLVLIQPQCCACLRTENNFDV